MKVKDFSTIKRGSSPRPIIDFLSSNGYPWLKISDFSCGQRYIYETKEYIKPSGLNHTRYVKKGTLIITNSASPGIPIFLGKDMCLHDGFLYFEEINENIIPMYLYYYFLSNRDKLVKQGNGSVFVNLKKEILENTEINIPSLDTQQHIVNIIGSIDDYIENLQQEISSYIALGNEIFKLQTNMYTIKAKAILNFQKGVEVGSKEYLEVKNENTIEYFRVADLNSSKSETFVNTIFLEKAYAKFGDVMITFDGCPGRVGYCVNGCFSGSIRKIIDINKKYNNGYLYFWSVSENVQNCIKEHSFGTTILHASKAIEHLEIINEPNEEILNQLNIIFKKMVSNSLIIQTLNELKQIYLKKFFG